MWRTTNNNDLLLIFRYFLSVGISNVSVVKEDRLSSSTDPTLC